MRKGRNPLIMVGVATVLFSCAAGLIWNHLQESKRETSIEVSHRKSSDSSSANTLSRRSSNTNFNNILRF